MDTTMHKEDYNKMKPLSTSLKMQLLDLGIHYVIVKYDGGNDSGAISTIEGYSKPQNDKNDKPLNFDLDDLFFNADYYLGECIQISEDLAETLQGFAYEVLKDAPDWWNDDGGEGVIVLSIADNKCVNRHVIIHREIHNYDDNITPPFED